MSEKHESLHPFHRRLPLHRCLPHRWWWPPLLVPSSLVMAGFSDLDFHLGLEIEKLVANCFQCTVSPSSSLLDSSFPRSPLLAAPRWDSMMTLSVFFSNRVFVAQLRILGPSTSPAGCFISWSLARKLVFLSISLRVFLAKALLFSSSFGVMEALIG